MKILFMATEAAPLVKVGGLADVAGALPRALAALGHEVWLLLPHAPALDEAAPGLRPAIAPFTVDFDWAPRQVALLTAPYAPGVTLATLVSPDYFDRPALYGAPDDDKRFIFFSKVGLEAVRRAGWQPDLLHAHDWHTAAALNWLAVTGRGAAFWRDVGAVFTIHNLAYQGITDLGSIGLLGVEPGGVLPIERERFGGMVNLMARGIAAADIVTTVSPTYAREILTPAFGAGLEGLLQERAADLRGILNGLDPQVFDPATDRHLAAPFDSQTLEGRAANKRVVQERLGLPPADGPLLGIIARMTEQKGVDLIIEALEGLLGFDLQLAVLGAGEPRYEERWRAAAARYPDRVGLLVGFDAALAQLIYGGSDLFLMPSRFEPCGLGQMISMRYGSLPVVRATGGLADTVVDADTRAAEGTGFVFTAYTPVALLNAVARGLIAYHQPERWRALMRRAMAVDFSWARAAPQYDVIYNEALDRARARL